MITLVMYLSTITLVMYLSTTALLCIQVRVQLLKRYLYTSTEYDYAFSDKSNQKCTFVCEWLASSYY